MMRHKLYLALLVLAVLSLSYVACQYRTKSVSVFLSVKI